MNTDEYQRMFELEDAHWWFVGRRRIIRRAIERYVLPRVRPTSSLRILDAGCGTGGNLDLLSRYGPACGVDYSESAVAFCRRRGLSGVRRASILDLPIDRQSYDLITLLDVLYHRWVGDEVQALRRVRAALSPGGFALITEPAFEWLRSSHDEALWSRRRHTRATLRRAVEEASFSVVKLTYVAFVLFPVVAAVRLAKRVLPAKSPASDLWNTPPVINRGLATVLDFESRILPFTGFPWGSSLLCVARRSD